MVIFEKLLYYRYYDHANDTLTPVHIREPGWNITDINLIAFLLIQILNKMDKRDNKRGTIMVPELYLYFNNTIAIQNTYLNAFHSGIFEARSSRFLHWSCQRVQ